MKPLILRIIKQCLLISVICFWDGLFSTFEVLFWYYLFLVSSWVSLTFFNTEVFFLVSSVELLSKSCLNWFLSRFFPSLLLVIDGFTVNSNLDWHLWPLKACRISIQSLLGFRVSTEKSLIFLELVFVQGDRY